MPRLWSYSSRKQQFNIPRHPRCPPPDSRRDCNTVRLVSGLRFATTTRAGKQPKSAGMLMRLRRTSHVLAIETGGTINLPFGTVGLLEVERAVEISPTAYSFKRCSCVVYFKKAFSKTWQTQIRPHFVDFHDFSSSGCVHIAGSFHRLYRSE